MTIAHPAHPSTREERALELYRTRGREIERVGRDLYLVPSGSGEGVYRVRYGASEESCSCPDCTIRGEVCKHILAVGVANAKRRGATVRRLEDLEDRLRHELLSDAERQELRDRVLAIRRRLGR